MTKKKTNRGNRHSTRKLKKIHTTKQTKTKERNMKTRKMEYRDEEQTAKTEKQPGGTQGSGSAHEAPRNPAFIH
jgi:hypothetical protein